MRKLKRLCAILVCLLSAGAAPAAVVLPEYNGNQLQDKEFVRGEIVRLSNLREELLKQNENASAVVQMTLKRDLQKVDSALEALRYVESAGFRKDDPKLGGFSYFQSSHKPFEGGFRHNMTPAGPRGGRISFLDGKPRARAPEAPRLSQAAKPPAPKPAARPAPPPPRPPAK